MLADWLAYKYNMEPVKLLKIDQIAVQTVFHKTDKFTAYIQTGNQNKY